MENIFNYNNERVILKYFQNRIQSRLESYYTCA